MSTILRRHFVALAVFGSWAFAAARYVDAQIVVPAGGSLTTPVSNSAYTVQALGTLILKRNGSTPQSGKITLQRGVVIPYETATSNVIEITGPIEVQGFGHIGLTPYAASAANFRGPISGYGAVSISGGGAFNFYGPVNFAGDLLIHSRALATFHDQVVVDGDYITEPLLSPESDGVSTWLEKAPTIRGDTLIRGGQLSVGVDSVVNDLLIDSRKIQRLPLQTAIVDVADGKSLTVSGNLDFRGGEIHGDVRIAGDLVKRLGTLGTLSRLGNNFNGNIVVDEGALVLADSSAVGSTTGNVRVMSTRAAAQIGGNTVIADNVYLNNSTGYDFAGGLLGATPSSGMPELSGDLFLGDQGAYVGGLTSEQVSGRQIGGNLKISGAIHGGALHKAAAGYDLVLTSANNDYTGPTHILDGRLILQDAGRLATTSEIQIFPAGLQTTLRIDDSGSLKLADRVADSVPISSRGGRLQYVGAADTASQETLGVVQLQAGSLDVRVEGQANLQINQLQRDPHAAVQFTLVNSGSQVQLPNAALTNGLLGAWAVSVRNGESKADDFVTLGPNGVARYMDVQSYQTDLNAAGPSDNVSIGSSSNPLLVTHDIQVNALRTSPSFSSPTIDLQGHQLRVESGGILMASGSLKILNGNLTAGGGSSGDLILYGDHEIGANIVDSAAGPVSLVVVDTATLTGANTYSGATAVHQGGNLIIGNRSALPASTSLILDGGGFQTTLQDGLPLQFDTITLRGEGIFRSSSLANQLELKANEYHFESGTVNLRLSGTGQLIKQGEGYVSLQAASPNFNGQIIIEQGTLYTSGPQGLGGGAPSESRATIVRAGGILEATGVQQELVILDGGTLRAFTVNNGDQFEGAIDVRQASRIETIRGSTLLRLHSPITGNAPLTVVGPLSDGNYFYLNSNLNQFKGNLSIAGGNVRMETANSTYTGNVTVSALELLLRHSDALGRGVTTVLPEGGITLDALTAPLTTKLNLAGGTLRLRQSSTSITGAMRFEGTPEIEGYAPSLSTNFAPILLVNAPSSFADNTRLSLRGQTSVVFLGNMTMEGKTELVAYEGSINITQKIIAAGANTSLNLIGHQVDSTLGSIDLLPGASFTLLNNSAVVPITFATAGANLSGNGTLGSPVSIGSGGTIMPGNSTGQLHFADSLTLLPNSTIQWEISDALGTPGMNPGWDSFVVDGLLQINATAPQNFVNVQIVGLSSAGGIGTISNFDVNHDHRWLIASAHDVAGFSPEKFKFNLANFTNNNPIPEFATFRMDLGSDGLAIVYQVPEPAAIWGVPAVALFAVAMRNRLRRRG